MAQFIKLEWWMTELGLSGCELIAFAVIHGYTAYAGSYTGGMSILAKWCGVSRQHAYRYLQPLLDKGLVKQIIPSAGRTAAVYASVVNRPNTGQMDERLTVPKRDAQPSQIGTLLDNNRYIDNPPLSPQRGKRKRKPNRALNYMHGETYSESELKKLGISLGEEFYEDNDYKDSLNELRLQ